MFELLLRMLVSDSFLQVRQWSQYSRLAPPPPPPPPPPPSNPHPHPHPRPIYPTITVTATTSVTLTPIQFFSDRMVLIDIASLLPFFVVVIQQRVADAALGGTEFQYSDVQFEILASSPKSFFITVLRALAILRLVRLIRHFTVTRVLFETLEKCFYQILAMVGMLTFAVTCFAVIIYELESGHACYVGAASTNWHGHDPSAVYDFNADPETLCRAVPDSVSATTHLGRRLVRTHPL
jgi:hypothetical protein